MRTGLTGEDGRPLSEAKNPNHLMTEIRESLSTNRLLLHSMEDKIREKPCPTGAISGHYVIEGTSEDNSKDQGWPHRSCHLPATFRTVLRLSRMPSFWVDLLILETTARSASWCGGTGRSFIVFARDWSAHQLPTMHFRPRFWFSRRGRIRRERL